MPNKKTPDTNVKEVVAQELSESQKSKAQLKAERKAAFEAQRSSLVTNKAPESSSNKSKAELKAERRAKQESQRAAKGLDGKESKVTQENPIKLKEKPISEKPNEGKKIESAKLDAELEDKLNSNVKKISLNGKTGSDMKTQMSEKKFVTSASTAQSSGLAKKGQIFAHLPQKHCDIEQLTSEMFMSGLQVHHSVVQVGLRMNKGMIKGSNARCVAMFVALKSVIKDYVTPPSKELSRDLESQIDLCVKFLTQCRPLSVSMTNAIKFLKLSFSKIASGKSDSEAKADLCSSIDNFITEEIICAQTGIAENAMTKIKDEDDVILVFGCSLIVKHILYMAIKKKKKFRVVVVDSRPRFDGREMLKYLLELNIEASYIFINAVAYVMKEVTKVLLGAHSLLANGYVMSHLGSSQLALVANAYNVPVLVCCETYKFSERVHTDSFVHNELADSKHLLHPVSSKSQLELSSNDLNILDLLYDVTPPEFVSVVITEIGSLPCSSAPAVLRFRETK